MKIKSTAALYYSLLLFHFVRFPNNHAVQSFSLDAFQGTRVLVVGGSGRVGGSVVTQLIQAGAKQVSVGGTSEDRFQAAKRRWQVQFPNQQHSFEDRVDFLPVQREEATSISSHLQGYDLVIHTAGPFQGKVSTPNGILTACVEQSVPYLDVCDDYCTARAAQARYGTAATTPCILSTGCWPGVSSLMAKKLVNRVVTQTGCTPNDLSIDFDFFTAGSGGAGVTLLVATFLILAEPALKIVHGRRRSVPAMKEYTTVDFGNRIGPKPVAPLNLLETASLHDTMGVGNVQCRFGTAPGFWNTLLGVMGQLPANILSNETLMRQLSLFSLPIVRLVDRFAGATNAMRVTVSYEGEVSPKRLTALYGHENLESCVGECVVAFGAAVLAGAVRPGVWFPEQAIDEQDIAKVLQLASVDAHTRWVEATGGMELDASEVWGSPSMCSTTTTVE